MRGTEKVYPHGTRGWEAVTEWELVDRARAGDQDAFEQLVLNNQNRVYTLALRMVNDREEAADLAQEAFLKAWQGLPAFQGDSSFSTWVYRLASNVCIDYLRKQKRRREVEPVLSLDDEESGWTEPADWDQDPQRQLERAERSRAVARGLEALPDHHRQVLTLSGDRTGAGTGHRNGEIPDRPGPAGLAENLVGGRELFWRSAV